MKFQAEFSLELVRHYVMANTTHHEPIIHMIAQELYKAKRGDGLLADLWLDEEFIERFYEVQNNTVKKAA